MGKHNYSVDFTALAQQHPAPGPEFLLALGLDFGRSTGYAYTWFQPETALHWTQPMIAGQIDLSAGPWDTNTHMVRLNQFLEVLKPDLVMFEDVRYTPAAAGMMNVAAVLARTAPTIEFFASLKATASMYGTRRGRTVQGVPIQSIKKRATGKGNASKEEVIAAANAQFAVQLDPADYKSTGADNVADAIWCLVFGLEALARGCDAPTPGARKRR